MNVIPHLFSGWYWYGGLPVGVKIMLDELLELQTQLSYQEDTIAQLNEVVTRQQKDIERLTEAFCATEETV